MCGEVGIFSQFQQVLAASVDADKQAETVISHIQCKMLSAHIGHFI